MLYFLFIRQLKVLAKCWKWSGKFGLGKVGTFFHIFGDNPECAECCPGIVQQCFALLLHQSRCYVDKVFLLGFLYYMGNTSAVCIMVMIFWICDAFKLKRSCVCESSSGLCPIWCLLMCMWLALLHNHICLMLPWILVVLITGMCLTLLLQNHKSTDSRPEVYQH